ncbi:MAG: DapH/DapD/GlmU-related protein [Candidatus Thalassarchaeaceae archaeon]|nr:DapH/DapD/GlmU-related protein [Candidatus Thalassarchaeaceae archaeon]
MTEPLGGFRWIQSILSILVTPLGFILWGIAAVPAIFLCMKVGDVTVTWAAWQRALALGATLGIGMMLWCFTDLLIIGILGRIIRPRLEDVKAPTESWLTIHWGFLSLFHRLALPALKWMVPSFIGNAYYRMMGCKIGKDTHLNSPLINDCFMVEIGSRTVIGGNAVVNGHLFEKDGIHLAKIRIGDDVVIGTAAQINPGCIIGDGAVIASKAVLPKFTEVPTKEIWGGIPAKCIRLADGTKPE